MRRRLRGAATVLARCPSEVRGVRKVRCDAKICRSKAIPEDSKAQGNTGLPVSAYRLQEVA